tara:strand:- start:4 stop:207 length:204 start_codon:yes stop_codon:yes gene_type:complete
MVALIAMRAIESLLYNLEAKKTGQCPVIKFSLVYPQIALKIKKKMIESAAPAGKVTNQDMKIAPIWR